MTSVCEGTIERTHDEKEDCKHGETHELDWFTSPDIDESERCQITRNESSRKYQVSQTDPVQIFVHRGCWSDIVSFVPAKANGRQDEGGVQA